MNGGPRVFLVPSSNREAKANFQRTVVDGVEADRIRNYSEIPFRSERLPVWGTKEGNYSTWEQLREGDYLLFYQDGHYPFTARILATEENEPLGRDLWPDHDADNPWKYVMYLWDLQEIAVTREQINTLANYSDQFAPMGFQTLNQTALDAIEEKFGSVREFLRDTTPIDRSEPAIDITAQPSVDIPMSVLDGLHFPNETGKEILDQVNSALNAGKHLIFTGPPGTGKTEIAKRVANHLVVDHPSVFSGAEITTATADWSTFETVGGYMPREGADDGESLAFEPGQVLRRFKNGGEQRNELIVIDEINRADIDKAFGQLFTLLSGQGVQLPYEMGGTEIEIIPASELKGEIRPHQYVMPASWRIFATMNSYDKTSLYEMSYAFMRRFAFVHVSAPDLPQDPEERQALVKQYADVWGLDPTNDVINGLGEVWAATNGGPGDRKIGPAILEDMMRHITSMEHASVRTTITQAVANYVFPQLEGVPDRSRTVNRIARSDHVDRNLLWRLAGDVLGVKADE